MELQLGLALPTIPIKGFDLNSYGYESKEVFGSDPLDHRDYYVKNKKRSFDEAFDPLQNVEVPQTLPLLVWNNLHPYDEDDLKGFENNSFTSNKIDGDANGVIGWPPIKPWRKKLFHHKYSSGDANYWTIENGGGRGPNSTYVKVKMEGVAIARKVDLSLHHSYQTLFQTLVGMFGKRQENVKAYKLTFQDKEGDWLLVGDVPWGTFIRSVKRLNLLKNGGS